MKGGRWREAGVVTAMPSSNELRGLLGEMLRAQPDRPETEPFPDEPRLREAISGKRPLAAHERRQLLRSPRARARLVEVAAGLRAQTRAEWRQTGVVTDIVYQAAAADEAKPTEVRPVSVDGNRDFGISLFPLDAQGQRWTVSLRLSQRVMAGLAGQIRLVDSGGGLWLQGRPDADRELSGDWRLPGSPLDRLRQFKLSIEPL